MASNKEGSTGLLARMAQMLRTPVSGQKEPVEPVQEPNGEADKQDVQARISAKRHDDMVRWREFDHLRKVRARGKGGVLQSGRPSVFQNSSSFRAEDLPPEARARTISKIDAIEAHMSQSWGPERRATPRFAGPIAPPVLKSPHGSPPPGLGSASPALSMPAQEDDLDLDFTDLLSAPLQAPPAAVDVVATETHEIAAQWPQALLEAAICFAEGDYDATVQLLQTAIQPPDADDLQGEHCMCALLEVFRASDSPERFDEVAIAYAQRFGRSAPEWFSVLDRLGAVPIASDSVSDTTDAGAVAWLCPPDLGAAAVSQLATWQAGSSERHVHWGALQSVAPDGVPALSALFTHWAAQPLALIFSGSEILNAVLQAATPEGDSAVDPARWHLRLEALRLQGAHEVYDNVALDYCLTYEISPPSWADCCCTFLLDAGVHATGLSPLAGGTQPQVLTGAQVGAQVSEVLELRGFLLGGATEVMEGLRSRVPGGEPLVIQCAHLARVDMEAGHSLLDWLIAAQNQNLQVRFVQLPRLVAALFHRIGVSQYAEFSVAG